MNSLIPQTSIDRMIEIICEKLALPGHVAEAGVYQGGSAEQIAKAMVGTGKELHLFDTFSGMPDATSDIDYHKPGDFGDVDFGSIVTGFSEMDFVKIHKGLFKDTLQDVSNMKFCFVHVDCDLYSSVKECCEFFYDKMVVGGVMWFDDYSSPTCVGAKAAVDEFFANRQERIVESDHGPVFIVKVSTI